MRQEWIFDRMQAEVAYRTEELYKARSVTGHGVTGHGVAGHSVAGHNGRRWWQLRRRAPDVSLPEQRRPSHDQRLSSVSRAG